MWAGDQECLGAATPYVSGAASWPNASTLVPLGPRVPQFGPGWNCDLPRTNDIAPSPDSRWAIVAADVGVLALYGGTDDVSSWSEWPLLNFSDASAAQWAVDWHPHTTWAVSGGADATLRLWDFSGTTL